MIAVSPNFCTVPLMHIFVVTGRSTIHRVPGHDGPMFHIRGQHELVRGLGQNIIKQAVNLGYGTSTLG